MCIPKTIDNDIDIIDRSFGFNTAVEQAVHMVRCARTGTPPIGFAFMIPFILLD
jgi:6-phosphofructokinase